MKGWVESPSLCLHLCHYSSVIEKLLLLWWLYPIFLVDILCMQDVRNRREICSSHRSESETHEISVTCCLCVHVPGFPRRHSDVFPSLAFTCQNSTQIFHLFDNSFIRRLLPQPLIMWNHGRRHWGQYPPTNLQRWGGQEESTQVTKSGCII